MSIISSNNFSHDQTYLLLAKKALSTFLNQSMDDISCNLLTGGTEEDKIVQCRYLSINYVVKIFNRCQLGKNEIAWTQLAWDLHIGPQLYYADPDGNYMLIEFAKGSSLIPSTANKPPVIKNVALSLLKLHHSSAPFAHALDMFTRIDAKYNKLQCAGELKNLLEKSFVSVKKIGVQLQGLEVPLVPCHNDLNWGNIFVNNNQVIFIDWGDAALGDPYYDIAAFFVLNIIDAESQKLFFEQYDSRHLSPQWQSYMQLYKQIVYFEFALNLLSGVQGGKNELLYAGHIPQVNNIDYYLTHLANRDVKIDSRFLYEIAIASLFKLY